MKLASLGILLPGFGWVDTAMFVLKRETPQLTNILQLMENESSTKGFTDPVRVRYIVEFYCEERKIRLNSYLRHRHKSGTIVISSPSVLMWDWFHIVGMAVAKVGLFTCYLFLRWPASKAVQATSKLNRLIQWVKWLHACDSISEITVITEIIETFLPSW